MLKAKTKAVQQVEMEDLWDIEVSNNSQPMYGEGSVWSPINHGILADLFLEELTKWDASVKESNWFLCMNGTGLMGDIAFQLNLSSEMVHSTVPLARIGAIAQLQEAGYHMHLLFRHSNNTRWSLSVVPALWSNEAQSAITIYRWGQLNLVMKHTGQSSYRQFVINGVNKTIQSFYDLWLTVKALPLLAVEQAQGDATIIDAREAGLQWNHLRAAIDMWRSTETPKTAMYLLYALGRASLEHTTRDQVNMLYRSFITVADLLSRLYPEIYTVPPQPSTKKKC